MVYDTFIIGLMQFLSPGSFLVSLTLLFIMFVFGRTSRLQTIASLAYMCGVVLFYFVVIQNGYAYLRYIIVDQGLIAVGCIVFGSFFILCGVFLFCLWFRMIKKQTSTSTLTGQKLLKFTANLKPSIWRFGRVFILSFILGCATGFLALHWVDNHQVLRFLVQVLAGQDFNMYFSLVGIYIFMLMFPVFLVFGVIVYFRKSRLFDDHKIVRYFLIINASLFLAVGSSYYLIQ